MIPRIPRILRSRILTSPMFHQFFMAFSAKNLGDFDGFLPLEAVAPARSGTRPKTSEKTAG